MIFNKMGGRKFLLTVAAFFGNGALLWFHKLDATTYRDVFLGSVAAYIAGNVYQKVKGSAVSAP